MAGHRVGSSAVRPSAFFQRTRRANNHHDDAHPCLLVSEAEVQAVADTNPVALRTLFLPDYDGVATSFAGLLQRVVQRCKWDGQASALYKHQMVVSRLLYIMHAGCDGKKQTPDHATNCVCAREKTWSSTLGVHPLGGSGFILLKRNPSQQKSIVAAGPYLSSLHSLI